MVRATLTFDPLTGGLAEVDPDPDADDPTRHCIEQAVRHAITKGTTFEPRAPEDASIACTFALGRDPTAHTCERLGPKGDYVDAPHDVGAG
jgi:hypothetical protein